jgi:hypothetical protein
MEIQTTTKPITEGRNWGRTAMLAGLVFGVALAFTIAFAPAAHAQTGVPDPSAWADTAIQFLKKLWVFVIIAEVIAALTYAVAFFTQSWFPSFFQAFQGEWVKKAVIIGVAAHPVLGALFAAAEGAKGGFQ